ncbi:unnamed protein product, partial [Closterium sp. NIES-65]
MCCGGRMHMCMRPTAWMGKQMGAEGAAAAAAAAAVAPGARAVGVEERACVCRRTGRQYWCRTLCKAALRSAAAVEAVGRKVAMLEMVRGAPHVVTMLRAFEDTQAIHMVLEHCPGGNLADRLASCRAFSEPDAAAVVRQVAAGLAACHEMGVVHRGVSAEAVLLMGQEGSPVDVRLSGFQHATFFEPGKL